ncbi:hypothetical protein ACUNV4_13340 [Granulosicoccus sp. 3-233]|uniref:hypothetical protein n=1 Tax=Granulosicoccus sp. 3-233 TaxID=3417969 RepID=UPI003D328332
MDIEKTVSTRTLGKASLLLLMFLLSACGGSGGDSVNGGGDDGGDVDIIEKDVVPEARGLLPSLSPSIASFEGEHHAGSEACSTCHNDASMEITTPIAGETRNVSIGTAWETSMMANSTRDPYWHAVVASELDNYPHLEEVINDECIVCHAPLAHDLTEKEGLDLRLYDQLSANGVTVINPGLYSMDDSNEVFNHAMDGVSCSLCHQMDGTNLGTEESMSGGFEIVGSPTGDPMDRPAYGQYADPEVSYMRQQVGYLAQQGLHISTSESCATCHNLNVHSISQDGEPLEDVLFAEQATFTEWQNSEYAIGGPQEATCQSCHMPRLDQDVYIGQGAPDKRPDFSEHTFLGANTVVQTMLMNYSEELGLKPGMDFEASIQRNREFLKTSADVTISGDGVVNGELQFDVHVRNQTGHRLPSGYHSRRVYLHVQVLDSSGELIFESGRIRPDGSIVGVAEDVNSATWEPHHDVITSETQVQVYQAITGNSDGDRTHSLLASSFYLKDNRLTPAGMNKGAILNDDSLPDTFGVFGAALTDDDFNNGEDTVSYRIAVGSNEVYTVSAELRYQSLSYGHLQKLWTQGDRVDQVDMFRTMYDNTTLRDEVIDTATQIMQ